MIEPLGTSENEPLKDRIIKLDELDPAVRDLIGPCEVTGERTIVSRDQKPIAIILSWDEYLAMSETIALAASDRLRSDLAAADEELSRNALMLPEDLFVE